MARYKPYSYEQTKLIPISYDRQILPGTFELKQKFFHAGIVQKSRD
jgi:hypothetical protein